jgi:hypothetical protein
MDGLSTSAREWTPGGSSGQRSINSDGWQTESDLTASTVKEFIPGLGWTAGVSSSEVGELSGSI